MARKLSNEQRRKISAAIEAEENEKKAQIKAHDERELRKLKNQMRMVKDSNLKDAGLEKHLKVKGILVKDKTDLEDNMKQMRSLRRCIMDKKQSQDIANLFGQGDNLDEAIAQERNYIVELEAEIRGAMKHIQNVKKIKGPGNAVSCSDFVQKEEGKRADRTLEAWKSRLAAEQTQLAVITRKNEEMRAKVQHLIWEKGQFNKVFGDLMGKLTMGKRVMVDIVERSKQQFHKRDEVSRKIEALRSRDKVDLAKRMEEMQELEMRLHEDQNLANFRYRVQMLREKLDKRTLSSTRDSVKHQRLTSRLEKANEYWAKIQEATGLTTVEEVCKHVVSDDSNIFSLFTFNNEVRYQVEVLTKKTADLVTTVTEENEKANDTLQDSIRKKTLTEKKLELLEQKLNDMEEVFRSNTRLLNRLLDKIKVIFDLMKCKTSTLQDLLGDNTKVTEHNYRLYLNLVEGDVIVLLESLGPLLGLPAVPYKSEKSLSRMLTISQSQNPLKRTVTRMCLECTRLNDRLTTKIII